ncbi:molybdenum cofactor sulfurase-like [Anopheles albimanus]|uniref:Molybdenum cofactor sulfurase n=1 Tax=Anopheles albimanus TaxID=7167 RepID=A0A182FCZ9_ANOAL|nr:molybdenum cofactor sulfurase-like [Anopheles albimanus]
MEQIPSEYSAEEASKIAYEFRRLQDKCYLDHAGTALYGEAQMSAVQALLTGGLFCNPHTSRTMEDLIDLVRFRVLRWFNTRPAEYSVVFTSGTTASLKLLAEAFDFTSAQDTASGEEPEQSSGQAGTFVYLRDSHTSVLGMRQAVRTERIGVIERSELFQTLASSSSRWSNGGSSSPSHHRGPSLLVMPAQCNFNGVKYPLELLETVSQNGLPGYEGDVFQVCLDAASYVSTSYLDLSRHKPSFVCVSFYKIFGYPTGLGALLVRKDAERYLAGKRYFGGGTVQIAMSGQNFHVPRTRISDRFEDGTINFLAIASLLACMEQLERLIPPTPTRTTIERISQHTFQLAQHCYRQLQQLEHANGSKVIELYHDTAYSDGRSQGPIVNFNVLNDDGGYVGFAEVACMASNHGIYLRTGCFCNPGACQRHLRLSDDDIRRHFQAGHVCGDANDLIDGQPTGSVRVSFGYMNGLADVERLLGMISRCYIRRSVVGPLVSRKEVLARYKNYDRARLVQICLFPIKSCGPFRVVGAGNEWPLSDTGLLYDREFVIVDEHGMAMTQKKVATLCLIRPTINLAAKQMTLHHPDVDEDLMVDLADPDRQSDDRPADAAFRLCQTKVCQDSVQGVDCGEEAADWVSLALGVSGLRLLRQTRSHDQRARRNRNEHQLSLNNQAQFLLINRTSVRWLSDAVDDWGDVDDGVSPPTLDSLVDRFRGNLIIETSRPLEEADWGGVTIGERQFGVDGPCTRCQMICIDQATGKKTAEPLRTICREFGGKMRFGIYLSHAGTLTEGATLVVDASVSGIYE